MVVKPLVKECAKREVAFQKVTNEVIECKKSLKILFAVTKSPTMSNLVYKAERKRFTKDKLKEISDNAILTLRQYHFDESSLETFIDHIYDNVFEQINAQDLVLNPAFMNNFDTPLKDQISS